MSMVFYPFLRGYLIPGAKLALVSRAGFYVVFDPGSASPKVMDKRKDIL